jgi:hypothetical protein
MVRADGWQGIWERSPRGPGKRLTGVGARARESTVMHNLAGALNRLDEGTAAVRVADGVTAGVHCTGATGRLFILVDCLEGPTSHMNNH